MKMTDNEIKKALEGLAAYDCKRCLDFGHDCFEKDCDKVIAEAALNLINQYEEEIETLQVELKAMRGAANSYKLEVERAQVEIERLHNILLSFTNEVATWSNRKGYDTTELSLIPILDKAKNVKSEIRSEAIKEFAERLKDKHKHNTTSVVSLVTVFDNINTLGKEMEAKE